MSHPDGFSTPRLMPIPPVSTPISAASGTSLWGTNRARRWSSGSRGATSDLEVPSRKRLPPRRSLRFRPGFVSDPTVVVYGFLRVGSLPGKLTLLQGVVVHPFYRVGLPRGILYI